MSPIASPRGFTLLETVVATGVLVTALAGLAQLFILSSQLARHANLSGTALIAAQSKLEMLAGLTFDYDAGGAAITDAALQPSPAASLHQDLEPYVDWIDARGQPRPTASEAVFVRRWRIVAIDQGPPESIAVEVCVFRLPGANASVRSAEACLSTVRTRQP